MRSLVSVRSALASVAIVSALVVATVGSAVASPSNPSIYLSKIKLYGCNNLEFGYVSNSIPTKLGDNADSLCTVKSFAKMSFSVPQGSTFADVTLYLKDVSCVATYYDNGTGTADHAVVSDGSKHRTVDIADAGGAPNCPNKTDTSSPARGAGNLSLVEAIH